jgi:hypothetical protein
MSSYIRAYEGEGFKFAVEEARRLATQLQSQATIFNDVIRWNSNQQVPPSECVELAAHIGLPINIVACTAARDADTAAFLTVYSKRRVSAEERAEMRAAFGPGAKVVNVITGRVTRV